MKKILLILFISFGGIAIAQNGCWKMISGGYGHTVAIKADGTLWAWGYNSNGQLGDGTTTDKLTPIPIGTATNWASISTGYQHTVAVKTDGTLWTWGFNGLGELGDGTTTNKLIPTQIGIDSNWKIVSAGSEHNIALKTDGSLWAWGNNYHGQLGDGTTTDKLTPTQLGIATNWASISAGGNHTIALKTDGTLWAWGYNYFGQLGDSSTINKLVPTQIGTATNWARINGGFTHTIAIKGDGSLWSWGDNSLHQLGLSTTLTKILKPTQIGTATNWARISTGDSHTIAIKTDSTLWGWGNNTFGQLGIGSFLTFSDMPIQIGTATNWARISTGIWDTYASKTDGSLWGCGLNNYGQLGDGTTTYKSVLTAIACGCVTTSSIVTANSCNSYYWAAKNKTYTSSNNTDTIKLTNAGGCDSVVTLNLTIFYSTHNVTTQTAIDKYIWAANGNTYTHSGTYIYTYTNSNGCASADTLKLTINTIPTGCWKSISAGAFYTTAIKRDGSLWAWGYNGDGALGSGDTIDKWIPTQVGTANNWAMVSAGYYHAIALKTDGSLWGWGWNGDGELGTGDNINRLTPTQIGTATNWASISAGGYHTIALKTDGTLWAWGYNIKGQLGNGDTINKLVPIQIGTVSNWASVKAGYAHSIALKTDGSLWAWGWNIRGQLGNGDTLDKWTPTQIGTATNWGIISAGKAHTIALKTNGTLWAWGSNSSGQLGDSSTINKLIPIQIGTATNWANVSAGNSYTIALKTNGSLWSWGWNYLGQLGYATTTSSYRFTPYQLGTDTNWAKISAGGGYHTIVLKNDSTLWSWGYNYYGQLGTGNNNSRLMSAPIDCPVNCYSTNGALRHITKGGINNVTMKISGDYSYNKLYNNFYADSCVTQSATITYKPTKNNDIAKANGVTSVDALLVQRHILNTTKLNNTYKLIAADVDGNKTVNSVDVLRIKRLILGTDTTFKNTLTTENRLWAFVDSAYQFPDTTNPFPFKDSISFINLTSNKTNQTFIGVKLGDVNFDWNSAVAKPSAVNCLPSTVNSQPSTENCVELFCQQTTVDSRPLTERSFAFSTLNSATLSALQTTIHFDNTKYEFVSINNNMFDIDFNTTQANTTGNISLVWIDKKGEAKEFKAGEELFSLQLRQRLTVSGQQFTDLQLNDDITPTAAYDEALNKRGITLVQKAVATNNLPFTTNNLTIYPNPTKGSFSIKLDNPISKGVLAITDVYGKQVYQEVLNKQSTIINCQLSKGMYCVNVITGKENQTQKLIVE